jgi:hypothetical protein
MEPFGFIEQANLIFWSSSHQQTCLHLHKQTPSNCLTPKIGQDLLISVRGGGYRIVLRKEAVVCDSIKFEVEYED